MALGLGPYNLEHTQSLIGVEMISQGEDVDWYSLHVESEWGGGLPCLGGA